MIGGREVPGTITFADGPGEGATLHVKRIPTLLRVVVDRGSSKVDCLDQVEDVPFPTEVVSVYELIAFVHVRGASREESGWRGTYKHRPDAPTTLRSHDSWVEWAQAEGRRQDAKALAKTHRWSHP